MRILGQNCFSQNQNHVGLQGTLISFQQTDYIYIKISCVHLNTILLTTSSQLFLYLCFIFEGKDLAICEGEIAYMF